MAFIHFDATTVAPEQNISAPIPAGTYTAIIVDSDVKQTKSGSGSYLKLTFEVMDGQFKNRKVFENLNIQNSSAQTQQIAQGHLSAICHATGVMQLQDSAQLHHKPLKIIVTVEPAKGDYGPQNRIKGYESASGAAPSYNQAPAPIQTQAAPAGFMPPAPAASGKPAWANK